MCQKVRRTIDVKVTCEPPSHLTRWSNWDGKTPYGSAKYWERVEEAYKDWVKELYDFMRDHRSRADIGLDVVAVYQEQCSACGNEWESTKDEDTGKECCSCCGQEVEEVAKSAKP